MDNQTQLQLPYEEITEVANRDFLRDNFRRSNREVYQIPFFQLQEREGFNKRIVYEDMEELAQSIKEQGLKEPLTVDVLPDGRVFIEKGHRRFKALQMIVEAGGNVDYVECYPNPRSVTELQRMTDIYTSNMHSCKLTAIEQSAVVFSLKNNFEKVSNEDIATRLGISRQKVDMLLLIAEASDDIKEQIKLNTMGITEACNLIRKQKKLEKQTDQVEEDSHKNSAAPTPFPKDELATEIKELDELEKQEVDEETGEVRMTNPELKEYESKGLDLVGNTVAENGKEEKQDDGTVKYDESRDEIKQVQNCIKLADKLEAITNKFDIPEGSKKDVADIVKWMQKNLAEVREWIHKNKKQNKAR